MAPRGFIQLLIIIALLIIIMSLLGVSLGELFGNKTLQENFAYVFGGTKYLWENYLLAPVKIITNTFKNLAWEPLKNAIENINK